MSGPRVTITLGRSGQVVRKAPSASDGSDYMPSPGRKRSMRERLGANADNSQNKRLRVENNRRSIDGEDEDMYIPDIRRDDLRYKLMRKSLSGRKVGEMEQGDPDLREKLLRTVQPPIRYIGTQMHPPESKPSSSLGRIPPTRSADDLLQLESMRKSYSPWRADGSRHRSPDRMLRFSRGGFSPPRTIDGLRTVSSLRHTEAARPSNPYLTRTVDASRPTTFMTKPPVPVESAKPVTRLPPSTLAVYKSSYMEQAEEPLSVVGLLHSLGLGKYVINFQAEEVDMAALKQMGDNDLKDLGIPMGPRKKILLAVMPRVRQRHI